MENDKLKNPRILNNFLDYLRMMNYSKNTRKSYCLDLLCFFKFLKDYLNIAVKIKEFNIFILFSVTEADVIAYMVYLNFYRDNTASTRQRRLSAIKKFYKWLFSNFPASSKRVNPTKELPNIRKVERLPRCLNLSQAQKLCNIFTIENSIYPTRNNTIMTLFLNTGLRVSELSNLNVCDVNFEEKYIDVIGKGNKPRKVFINESTKDMLLKWLKMENREPNSDEPLFFNHKKQRLKVWGIEKICKKAFRLAGIFEEKYSCHSLRHTFASIMYQYTNGDIFLIRDLLGHEDIATTQIYTQVFPERVKDAVNKHPLRDFKVA